MENDDYAYTALECKKALGYKDAVSTKDILGCDQYLEYVFPVKGFVHLYELNNIYFVKKKYLTKKHNSNFKVQPSGFNTKHEAHDWYREEVLQEIILKQPVKINLGKEFQPQFTYIKTPNDCITVALMFYSKINEYYLSDKYVIGKTKTEWQKYYREITNICDLFLKEFINKGIQSITDKDYQKLQSLIDKYSPLAQRSLISTAAYFQLKMHIDKFFDLHLKNNELLKEVNANSELTGKICIVVQKLVELFADLKKQTIFQTLLTIIGVIIIWIDPPAVIALTAGISINEISIILDKRLGADIDIRLKQEYEYLNKTYAKKIKYIDQHLDEVLAALNAPNFDSPAITRPTISKNGLSIAGKAISNVGDISSEFEQLTKMIKEYMKLSNKITNINSNLFNTLNENYKKLASEYIYIIRILNSNSFKKTIGKYSFNLPPDVIGLAKKYGK